MGIIEKKYRQRFIIRWIEKFSFDLILLVILFIACLVILFAIMDMVFEDKNTNLDDAVFSMIHPHINSINTHIMQVITFFGSPEFLFPANCMLAGIFLFKKEHRMYSLKVASVSLTSTGVMFLLKTVLQRQRPLVPLISRVHGYSFPSGHSFSSLVFFGMLAYFIDKTVKTPLLKWPLIIGCFAMALLIGFSRVYLKLHFASDVIAGFCLGIIWLLLARWLLVKTEKLIIPEY